MYKYLTFLVIFISAPFVSHTFAIDLNDALEKKHQGQPVISKNWMISAANPYAVEAGAAILENGGSAADAMIAAQTVLGLVEPQSSGLGGGAFLIWFDAETGQITTIDGRETASRHVTPDLFQDDTGKPLGFYDAVIGGKSVGFFVNVVKIK